MTLHFLIIKVYFLYFCFITLCMHAFKNSTVRSANLSPMSCLLMLVVYSFAKTSKNTLESSNAVQRL